MVIWDRLPLDDRPAVILRAYELADFFSPPGRPPMAE